MINEEHPIRQRIERKRDRRGYIDEDEDEEESSLDKQQNGKRFPSTFHDRLEALQKKDGSLALMDKYLEQIRSCPMTEHVFSSRGRTIVEDAESIRSVRGSQQLLSNLIEWQMCRDRF